MKMRSRSFLIILAFLLGGLSWHVPDARAGREHSGGPGMPEGRVMVGSSAKDKGTVEIPFRSFRPCGRCIKTGN